MSHDIHSSQTIATRKKLCPHKNVPYTFHTKPFFFKSLKMYMDIILTSYFIEKNFINFMFTISSRNFSISWLPKAEENKGSKINCFVYHYITALRDHKTTYSKIMRRNSKHYLKFKMHTSKKQNQARMDFRLCSKCCLPRNFPV